MQLLSLKGFFSSDRAVGLCLGQGAVRAVGLAKTETGYSITGSASVEFSPGGSPHPTEIESALFEVCENLVGERTNLVANVEARQSRIMFFDLPFDKPDKVRQVLAFTAEPMVMTPVEDLVFDYLPLTKGHKQGSPGLICGSSPEAVADAMTRLSLAGLEPGVILPDSLGLIASGMFYFEETHGYKLLLDLGAGQNSLALFEDGRPIASRTIPFGGNEITKILARAKDIDLTEAENLKRETDLSGPSSDITDILTGGWQRLVGEIERTLTALQTDLSEMEPAIYLCGGGAKTKGMDRFLADALGLEVKTFPVAEEGPQIHGMAPELLPAAGLAMLGLAKKVKPNLRQGDLAPMQALARYRGPLAVVAGALVLLAALFLANLYIDYRHQDQVREEAKKEMRRVFRDALPEVKRIVAPLVQMRQKLEQAKSGLSGRSTDRARVLDLLYEISRITKARVGLRLVDLSINLQTVEVQGEGGSFEDIDRLKDELANLPYFGEVAVGGARIDPASRKLIFKLSIKRKM